jgi:glycosyltransferase involved in cell wall biosynthesis
MIKYSVVVPVFNEQGNVLKLFNEIKTVMEKLGNYEIIFVDDGSFDNTVSALSNVKGLTLIELRKNFGQSLALSAGIDAAKGEIIITMDGDLQNDPADIPKLIAKLDSGYDAVSGWRYNRKDSFSKRVASRLQNFMRHFFIRDPLHDAGCSLKAYRRECLSDLELYGEFHRYIAEMVIIRGFKVGEVKVNHRPRISGDSKYGNLKRAVKGNLDLGVIWFWQKYAGRPLHLFGGLGLFMLFLGGVAGLWTVYLKLFVGASLSDNFAGIIAVFFVLAGLQLIIGGLLFDLNLRTYNKDKKRYSIRKITRK